MDEEEFLIYITKNAVGHTSEELVELVAERYKPMVHIEPLPSSQKDLADRRIGMSITVVHPRGKEQ